MGLVTQKNNASAPKKLQPKVTAHHPLNMHNRALCNLNYFLEPLAIRHTHELSVALDNSSIPPGSTKLKPRLLSVGAFSFPHGSATVLRQRTGHRLTIPPVRRQQSLRNLIDGGAPAWHKGGILHRRSHPGWVRPAILTALDGGPVQTRRHAVRCVQHRGPDSTPATNARPQDSKPANDGVDACIPFSRNSHCF